MMIILITQLIVLGIVVSYLIGLDMRILLLSEKVKLRNIWLESRTGDIQEIFSDIKFIVKKYRDKFKKRQRLLILSQIAGLIEWLILLFIKPKGKKFLLGYKLMKALVKELSMFKNMV